MEPENGRVRFGYGSARAFVLPFAKIHFERYGNHVGVKRLKKQNN
jgi:hypothetical protein